MRPSHVPLFQQKQLQFPILFRFPILILKAVFRGFLSLFEKGNYRGNLEKTTLGAKKKNSLQCPSVPFKTALQGTNEKASHAPFQQSFKTDNCVGTYLKDSLKLKTETVYSCVQKHHPAPLKLNKNTFNTVETIMYAGCAPPSLLVL